MNIRLSALLAVSLLLFPLLASAVVETYTFDDEVRRQRYQQFVEELRCPKCQNQNLAGSDSPIAEDLRRELFRLLQEGKSDPQIVDYMVARYGDFILYRPRLNAETALLWFAPLIFLLLGGAAMVMVYRRQSADTVVTDKVVADQVIAQTDNLDTSEQQQLQRLLDDTAGGDNTDA